jgi:hypothetical protein
VHITPVRQKQVVLQTVWSMTARPTMLCRVYALAVLAALMLAVGIREAEQLFSRAKFWCFLLDLQGSAALL